MSEYSRPWWKRKRWIAAGLLWLLLAYPLSVGPVAYAMTRGWYLPGAELEVAYAPLISIGRNPESYGTLSRSLRAYVRIFERLAQKHNGVDSRPQRIGISGVLLIIAATSGSLAVFLFVVQRKRRGVHAALEFNETRLL